MLLALTVGAFSGVAWLITAPREDRKAYLRHVSKQLRPILRLLPARLLRFAQTGPGLSARLEQQRQSNAEALRRRFEAQASEQGALVLHVSSLSGQVWDIPVGLRTSGAQLRAQVAQLAGIPQWEVRLVAGAAPLADDELVLSAVSSLDQVVMIRSQAKRVLCAGSADDNLRLLEAETGRPLATFNAHCKRAGYFAVDWERNVALSVAADSCLRLWDISDLGGLEAGGSVAFGAVPVEIFRGAGPHRCLTVDWKSWRALVGSGAELELWDLDQDEVLVTFQGHMGAVQCVDADWDAMLAISGSVDGIIFLWDLQCSESSILQGGGSAQQLGRLGGHMASITCVRLEGRRLARLTTNDAGNSDQSRPAVWVSRAITCSLEGVFKLWELQDWRQVTGDADLQRRGRLTCHCLWTVRGTWGDVRCADVDWPNLTAVTGAEDGTLKLWDLKSGTPLRTLISKDPPGIFLDVTSVSLDLDAGLVMSGSARGEIKVWDLHADGLESADGAAVASDMAERSLLESLGQVAIVVLEPTAIPRQPARSIARRKVVESADDADQSNQRAEVPQATAAVERAASGSCRAVNEEIPRPTLRAEAPKVAAAVAAPDDDEGEAERVRRTLARSGRQSDPEPHNTTCFSCCSGLKRLIDGFFRRRPVCGTDCCDGRPQP
ncbi:unnamed protein product [Polarella glacialis]|uniref:Peroxin-7 n=1 Tax=Polarella glacialis TaxID=89957 RepID=A0A813HE81_POLGL|nr:unnamed protein product [Polarella glacialis]